MQKFNFEQIANITINNTKRAIKERIKLFGSYDDSFENSLWKKHITVRNLLEQKNLKYEDIFFYRNRVYTEIISFLNENYVKIGHRWYTR